MTSLACKEAGTTGHTYYRWRKEYGGLPVVQARRLKELAQVQTGRPFTILISSSNSLTFNNEDRPNQVSNLNSGVKAPLRRRLIELVKYEVQTDLAGNGWVGVDL